MQGEIVIRKRFCKGTLHAFYLSLLFPARSAGACRRRFISDPASANRLHVVLLIEQPACHLHVFSLIRHYDDVIEEEVEELVVGHDCEESAEGTIRLKDGPAEVKEGHLQFEVLDFLA